MGRDMLSVDHANDTSRYNRSLPALPSPEPSEVYNEGDVRRIFAYFASFVEQAFSSSPKLWHRWEAGPPGLGVTTSETIDTWWGVYMGQYQSCAVIGELKRPGVIDTEEWGIVDASADTIQLGKEIRMADCVADCFIVGKQALDMPYWIDRLIAEGLERLRAEVAGPILLGGYDRVFRYYDGKPYWFRQGVTYWGHPHGYKRRFVDKEWWWYLDNIAQKLDTPAIS
ncbi:hypothetical protein HYALB_00000977 [Hymenoscyphus albidus]|uniref:Uncharacterized protein n=1 Tax=Hymenoscyphus albidus TaxID=595503 RepID=A0A9N9QCR6_9HELO|nr:hypothetical protein HYALB_00000977 [Hymenoscyphus albidus]